jgi:hypothetical protein
LDESHNCTILDEQVTYDKEKSTLRELLAGKGIYVFIQRAKYGGGSKIICQHSETFKTKVGKKTVVIAPRTWFITEIIMTDCNNWTSRQFNPRHKMTAAGN